MEKPVATAAYNKIDMAHTKQIRILTLLSLLAFHLLKYFET